MPAVFDPDKIYYAKPKHDSLHEWLVYFEETAWRAYNIVTDIQDTACAHPDHWPNDEWTITDNSSPLPLLTACGSCEKRFRDDSDYLCQSCRQGL